MSFARSSAVRMGLCALLFLFVAACPASAAAGAACRPTCAAPGAGCRPSCPGGGGEPTEADPMPD